MFNEVVGVNLLFEEETKREKRRQILKETIVFLIAMILVILAAWLIVKFALKKVSMIGSSMEPTLYNGQDVIVNRTSFLVLTPKRGAIIAFYPESEDDGDVSVQKDSTQKDSTIVIRRIVGLPGEKVLIKDGVIYINGSPLKEEYEFDEITSWGRANEEITLEQDEYFVLSDKRSDVDDSRSASFTSVRKKNIIGKVLLTLNPFALVSGPEEKSQSEEKSGEEE